MAKAIKSFETYTADFTCRIQFGMTAGGTVFQRIQVRNPRYGYSWTAWRTVDACVVDGLVDKGPQKWRLPGSDGQPQKAPKTCKYSCTMDELNVAMDKEAQRLGVVSRERV